MNYFLITLVGAIAYYAIVVIRAPENWPSYLPSLPILVFMTYARAYQMAPHAWASAFELAGAVSVIVIGLLWYHAISFDRIMLGLNLFLIIGGVGFLADNKTILQWHSSTKGGPLFGCIVLVGLLSMLVTRTGFIGVPTQRKKTSTYASFLLLAASFIALVWSITADAQGIFWAVAVPFVALGILRVQLIKHLLYA